LQTGVLTTAGLVLVLALGCHSFELINRDRHVGKTDHDTAAAKEPPLPGKYSLRIAPAIFFSDTELNRDHPVFQDLTGLRDQVYKELQLPPGNAVVQVYLFEDKERYEAFMQAKHPSLPRRRAFFIKSPGVFGGQDQYLVYTSWGDRVQQDLRHELTHALLNSVLKAVPLWLDEGLAEYFELAEANKGVNRSHVANLRRDLALGMKFDLPRLERLSDIKDMKPPEYRESWAWVHLMLCGTPETRTVLLEYLQTLRTLRDGVDPPPLAPKLATVLPTPEQSLARHIASLEGVRPLQTTPRDASPTTGDKWRTTGSGIQ
jgi:hypothetical protein